MKSAFMLALLFAAPLLRSQEAPPPIERYVGMIESGQADPVRAELPELLSKYPNDPGVLYLQGLLTKEGAEAVRVYQSIVDNHPKSEWADDALFRVYQFYQAIGLFRTAELKLNQLKRDYPRSRYVTGLAEETAPAPGQKETAPPPRTETAPAPQQPAAPAQGQFSLQVGAYSTQVNADKQKLFFEDLGYPVEVIAKSKDGRTLYTVNIGNYMTYDEAKAKSAALKKQYNVDSFVVTR
jgi:hypothetical protein